MKLPVTIYDSRFTICRKSAESAAHRQSSIVNRQSQRGVALILTLILLSVALVMALAFLAISGHERGSVTTQTDTATTRLAAEAGLAAAEAQIAANTLASTNPYSFGLIVSTNYINYTYGFQTGIANPTNVSYFDSATGNYLPAMANSAEFLQALANLSYLPRPPVFIPSPADNYASPTNYDFRFYLDLNRNGKDDPNGWVADVDNNGKTNGNYSFEVGDPEWIGVLEHPDQPYGPKNNFIARYAFIAVPVGNALDLNAIHNQAHRGLPPLPLNSIVNPPQGVLNHNDTFIRNEGVGSWEINLAAFLADLNTNQWDPPTLLNPQNDPYSYTMPGGVIYNSGYAFDDARALLAYRYNNDFNTLSPIGNLPGYMFGNPGMNAFSSDNIDGYTYGQPLLGAAGFDLPAFDNDSTLIAKQVPWVGADNTNHFFSLPSDLFDSIQNPYSSSDLGFTNRLRNAGGGNSTYDSYTFYRLLSQLGTDSAPESGKMNLNYDNLDPMVTLVGATLVTNPPSVNNFMPWQPLAFFTNAADRLLKASTAQWAAAYSTNEFGVLTNGVSTNFVATFNGTNAFGVTDIPVLVSNRFVYTPAVNRLLQLAANMYDATTTSNYPDISPEGQVVEVANGANYPDIFRPIFTVVPENGYNDVYITGYMNQSPFIDHANQMGEIAPPVDITALLPSGLLATAVTYTNVNVYGVPWIVGAKKGFPNFNAFSVESAFQLVRKLEVVRNTNSTPQPDIVLTNQMYLMNITNFFALSCWNSYRSNYPGPVDILVRCSSSIMLTNDNNMSPPNNAYVYGTSFNFAQEIAPNWPAWNGVAKSTSDSFIVPLNTSVLTLTNAMYYYNEPNPPNSGELVNYIGDSPSNYLDAGIRELPHFWLLMTNRLQVAIIDYSTNASPLNASGPTVGRIVDYVQLGGMDSSQLLNSALPENANDSLWNTNYDSQGNLFGVANQIQISTIGTTFDGNAPTGSGAWNTGQIPGGPTGDTSPPAQQAFFRGFFAQDGGYNYGGAFYVNTQTAMQAPYTPMAFAIQHTTWGANDPLVHYLASDLEPNTQNLQAVDWSSYNPQVPNVNYQPWGLPPPTYDGGIDANPDNLSFKDPLVSSSDNWDFPAGKLPTVGWLGRVHRGTPWQTVYLKAADILAETSASNPFLGVKTWIDWTGDGNLFDMSNSAPVEDRLLFDLFTTAFNDNATRGQLSVNISSNSLPAWSALFSGVTVFSNNLPNSKAGFPLRSQKPPSGSVTVAPSYTNLIIAPAGIYNSALPLAQQPALAQIVAGIDQTRATFTNADGLVGVFEHKGDILATPQLTEQSPFLNWNNAAQQTNGISDEMYEWLPQQVMSLVRASDAPRYVIYSYGQALKPAPNGTYVGSASLPNGQTAFGLVTNYQVVAEMATRAVVRLDTARTNASGTTVVTPPRAVIESFNILPPD